MRLLTTTAALFAASLTLAGGALAKPGDTSKAPHGQARGHAKAQPQPSAPGAKKNPGQAPATQGDSKQQPAKAPVAPRKKAGTRTESTETTGGAVPNSGCTAHEDPRDPGSCQEKGRGNSGDIDPYRGPDAEGNTPARGNDCDEGGGNNRTRYPRRTNPHNPGDSDVDNDRGRGNNRCGLTATEASTPLDAPKATPDPTKDPQGILPVALLSGAVPALETGTVLGAREVAPSGGPQGQAEEGGLPAKALAALKSGELPFTGLPLLWLALAGALLGGIGAILRRQVAAV
jgi:hypothetical protein